MWHTHRGILLGHKEERNPDIRKNMKEPKGHYTKWDKPDTEREILHDFIYRWNLNSEGHRSRG